MDSHIIPIVIERFSLHGETSQHSKHRNNSRNQPGGAWLYLVHGSGHGGFVDLRIGIWYNGTIRLEFADAYGYPLKIIDHPPAHAYNTSELPTAPKHGLTQTEARRNQCEWDHFTRRPTSVVLRVSILWAGCGRFAESR